MLLKGLFGPSIDSTTLKSEIKYQVRTASTESWEQKNAVHLANIQQTLIAQSVKSAATVFQSSTVELGSVADSGPVQIRLRQRARLINLAECTNQLFQRSLITEFASFLNEIDEAFRRENVSALRSAISREKNTSMVSEFLQAIGGGDKQQTDIGNVISSSDELSRNYSTRLERLRGEFATNISRIDFASLFEQNARQSHSVSIKSAHNVQFVSIETEQEADALAQLFANFQLLALFERTLDTSDIFKMVRSADLQTNSTADTSTSTVERTETFGDILQGLFSGLMMPLVVIGLVLVVVLVMYVS
ncbi:MAG: hypothetical protein E6Q06_01785 [Candidatus Moraniibacteriota bacterium]|nr:MAG: hypothetical protein E6Q06_01785 [Candidatus Moranbacteria bacterium]